MSRKSEWITTALSILCKNMIHWPNDWRKAEVTPNGWQWSWISNPGEMVLMNKDQAMITRGEWRAAMETSPRSRGSVLGFAMGIIEWPDKAGSSFDVPRGWFWREPMNGGHPYLSLPRWRHSMRGTPVGLPVTKNDVLDERRRIIDHKKEDKTIYFKAPTPERPYSKYRKDVSELDEVDVYDVCELFSVNDPSGATQHAIKKLLLSGQRTGGKAASVDIAEAIDSLKRAQELAKRREK